MSRIFRYIALIWALGLAAPAQAQEFSALARLIADESAVRDGQGGLVVDLSLTQAVPYRVFTLDDPRRLVVDFREVSWDGVDKAALLTPGYAADLRFGLYRPSWSRLVVDLAQPMAVTSAGMQTDPESGAARVELRLAPVSQDAFAARAGAPDDAAWGLPRIADIPEPIRRQSGEGPLRVVLDPGHGGIDPGAEAGKISEAELMLTFARELKELLLRRGGFEVVMTREEDVFVPLETRVSIARAAGADVFLSLHADALAEGRARGATVYTLSETASDEASAKLAERHDRADLLAGVDLSDADDVIATVLMDLARLDTAPRSEHLAGALVEGLRGSIGRMHKRPHLQAGFSVLKAPDIPSVLIELGFVSSPKDLENLTSPEWRASAAAGIADALAVWARADAAQAGLLRQ